jgi:excisionase family DNA binding protein
MTPARERGQTDAARFLRTVVIKYGSLIDNRARSRIGARRMLTVAHASEKLGLRQGTLRLWIAQRKIGHVRLGTRAVRIPVIEIDRIIERGYVPPREQPREH